MIRSRVPGVVRPLCFFRACVEVSRPGHRAADEPGEPGPSCVQRGTEATTALASARCARSTPSSSRVTTGAPRPGLAAYAQPRSGRSMASPDLPAPRCGGNEPWKTCSKARGTAGLLGIKPWWQAKAQGGRLCRPRLEVESSPPAQACTPEASSPLQRRWRQRPSPAVDLQPSSW